MASGNNPYESPGVVSNPYAVARGGEAPPGVWRQGKVLVMTKDAQLPARCVKTNQPAQRWLKRNMSWHHPAIALTILASPLIYVVVAMIVRKTANIQVGLTEERYSQRRVHQIAAWSLGLLSAAAMLGGCVLSESLREYTLLFLLGGFVALIGALIYGQYTTRIVAPQKIDDRFVWLTGVCEQYLAELPQWPY